MDDDANARPSETRSRVLRLLRERRAGGRWLPEPVIAILVLAGVAQILAGDPVIHGVALIVVASALVLESLRKSRDSLPPPQEDLRLDGLDHPSRQALLLALLWAVVAGTFSRYSWPATIAVAVPGVAGVRLAWGTPPRRETAPLTRAGTAAWAAVFLAFAAWEIATLLQQPTLTTSSWAHPTLSTLMDPVLASPVRRSLFLVGWLAFGRHLLVNTE